MEMISGMMTGMMKNSCDLVIFLAAFQYVFTSLAHSQNSIKVSTAGTKMESGMPFCRCPLVDPCEKRVLTRETRIKHEEGYADYLKLLNVKHT